MPAARHLRTARAAKTQQSPEPAPLRPNTVALPVLEFHLRRERTTHEVKAAA